ncbi:3-octaprenyl-4-hydroxybenzoate carboxy-lyase [Natranaerofaba carboxydovora]|nr:3-octaprenyl-4-hydroxybenzoate carboxy-lyase [Natranaerofaba carboxydovora]
MVLELERMGKKPVIKFNNIDDNEIPVVANTIAGRERFALAMGVDEEDISFEYAKRITNRIEPKILDKAPFMENNLSGEDIDLNRFPILTHFPIDASPYITAGLVVTKDPKTGANTAGYHRMQLKGKDKLGISLHSRQRLWEYFRRAEENNQNLEAAVVLGVHPNISLGSMALVPYHLGKFEAMGGLFDEPMELTPCSTIDLEVPAWAEIVIEGEILANEREPEGPFAEFTGYACHRSTENVFKVINIQYRNNPIYQCITPGMCAEHNTIIAVQREGDLLNALNEKLPNIKNVHVPLSSCGLFHCYIAMKKTAEGQPLQAIFNAFAIDHHIKLAVVVDEDVDVFNEEEVLWAICTRMQADQDTIITPQNLGMGETLDPSTDELSRTAKMGIDATMSLDDFSPRIKTDPEVLNKVKKIISDL